MKKFIVFAIILVCSLQNFAQSKTDSIEIRKNFFGTTFRQNGRLLSPNQIKNIVKPNPEAYGEMKKAGLNQGFSFVFSFAGGFLIGWPIGTSISGKEANWSLAAIGAGLTLISVPFTIATVKHTKKAVNIYNSGLKQKTTGQLDINFGMNTNGFGMTVKF